MDGLDVIEREASPAGNDGTCNYTIRWAKEGRDKVIVTGNLGGLSRTGGVWHATVDLGVTMPGDVLFSKNCGPNDVFTQHQTSSRNTSGASRPR